MYHSISIYVYNSTPVYHNTWDFHYNTWDTWHMIPSEPPFPAPPEFKSKYIEVPGMTGQLDISEIVTGAPVYDDRKGSWTFYVDHEFLSTNSVYILLQRDIHGKKMCVRFEDDPDYYYTGRLWVESRKNGKDYSQITLGYQLSPYKSRWDDYPHNSKNPNYENKDEYMWDPFNFEVDVIDSSVNPPIIRDTIF